MMETFYNQQDSSSFSKNKLQIVCATWNVQDHIKELHAILQDAPVDKVNNQFQKYVSENIEPTGWQAVWRSQVENISSLTLSKPLDFLVDVIDVDQFELKALVGIKTVINTNLSEDLSNEVQNLIHKKVAVSLLELYPTSHQENEVIDIEITTEVLEQMRFFYQNIMLPWDSWEEICRYTEGLLCSRMQTLEEIRNGIIPRKICAEMRSIKEKAAKISKEIVEQEKLINLSTESQDSEIDQNDLVHLMKLNKHLDILKSRYNALKDPMLREISVQEEHLERSYILSSFCEEPSNIFVVASSVPLDIFVENVSKLPRLLKELSQVPDLSRVKTLPSLQMALDAAQVGDVIALLHGTHHLKYLGSIGRGGIIVGLEDNVEIVGCHETGDVLLDLNLENDQQLVLHSLVLKPDEEQTSVFLHKGKLLVQNCVFQEGLVGLSCLSGSECHIQNSSIFGQEKCGLSIEDGSKVTLDKVRFKNCEEAALIIYDESMISIENESTIEECEIGLKLMSSLLSTSTENLNINKRCMENIEKIHFNKVKENYVFASK